ncbi:MAG: cyclic nucleotide-binding domain-containing protein [Oceanospirillaceae bacterium]|nr:cyclic nucleotide-binding domain-containing protein [Oceanospirillaceae bacterium]
MRVLETTELLTALAPGYTRELATFGALSDDCVQHLLWQGRLLALESGEVLYRPGSPANGFFVVISGMLAFYKHFETYDVLTRHFRAGEQLGFDAMIGLQPRSGTAVAVTPLRVLEIGVELFHDIQQRYPADFGLIMINLAREMSREIAALEQVIGQSTGWLPPRHT